jgi:hypothetical protein
VDTEALASPVDLEKVNKNKVNAGWKILTETPFTNDA